MSCRLAVWVLLGSVIAGAAEESQLAARMRAARLRVEAYVATGALQQAEAELLRLAEQQPDDRYVLGDLAAVQRRLGRGEEAAGIYRRLLQAYPGDAGLRDDLAYLLFDQAAYGEVVDVLAPLMADPERATTDQLQLLAVACDRSQQGSRADALYDALLSRHPDEPRYPLAMGERLLSAGRPGEARVYLERARALSPRDPRVLKGLARAVGPQDPDYEGLMLEALRRDLDDPEPAFLLGESIHGRDPERAAGFYREALQRLDAAPDADPFRLRLRARALFRLGDDSALALYDSLISRRPQDEALRVDVAELLLAGGHHREALARLLHEPSPPSLAPWRARAYAALGRWPQAAAEWDTAVRRTDAEVQKRLDRAEALWRSSRWQAALEAADSLRLAAPDEVAEPAYELTLEIRRRAGRSAGLHMSHAGLSGERRWSPGPSLRTGFGRSGRVDVRGSVTRFDDDATGFTGWGQRADLTVGGAPRPGWDAWIGGSIAAGRQRDRSAGHLGLQVPVGPGRRGRAVLSMHVDAPWEEPVDAVQVRGRYGQQHAALALPVGRWFLSLDGRRRTFLGAGGGLGEESRIGGYVSREVWRRPYGSVAALRVVSVTAGFEHARASQPQATPGPLRLPRRATPATLGLYARFLGSGRWHVDVAPFVGADADRDLGPAQLFGAAVGFQLYLRARLALHGDAFVASESQVQAAGGHYRSARLGLRVDLD